MKQRLSIFVIAILMTFSAAEAALGFESKLWGDDRHAFSAVGAQAGYLYGHTTYHISEYIGATGIESELEFPLQTILAGIRGDFSLIQLRRKEEIKISAQWLTNIDSGSGIVKDSDWLTSDLDVWGVGSAHPGKDIYSESDMKLRVNIYDLHASLNSRVEENLSIGPLLGYQYQNFKYDVSNVNQVGYGPYAPYATGTSSGKVATYEVTYSLLYLGLNLDYTFNDEVKTNIMLGYAPSATAEDRDDHMLRYKLNTGKGSGRAYLASLAAQWDMSLDYFIRLIGSYVDIETTGTQTQTWYETTDEAFEGDTIGGIDDKITSTQMSLMLLFTYRI